MSHCLVPAVLEERTESKAIKVLGLCYSRNKSQENVLKSIDLDIPKGIIYGLLGPSGCGKTTLLRCLTGCLHPTFGVIHIFGQDIGRHYCKIPGPNVGYMPQENALDETMSIKEILYYYGRIFLLSSAEIKQRIKDTIQMLDLPEAGHFVGKLSGGQKRRVSFAIALIHSPPLLILDEPTSGVDPLLRERIWNHLIYLSSNFKATIIITTHYIEEARRSHVVGFMRKGQILTQDNPQRLLKSFKVTTLEEVFLNLCRNQTKQVASIEGDQSTPFKFHRKKGWKQIIKNSKTFYSNWFSIFVTVLWRFLICDLRDPLAIGFQYFIPLLQVILFSICIGGEPFDIPLVIVNEEMGNNLSTEFINGLDTNLFRITQHSNLDTALETAQRLESWGVLRLRHNFTDGTLEWMKYSPDIATESVNSGKITVYADLADKIVSNTIMRYLDDYYTQFLKSMLKENSINSNMVADVPIRTEYPIYGAYRNRDYKGLKDFMIPGLIVNITFAIAYSLTNFSLIKERQGQTMERNYVSGVTITQMILAQILSRIILMIPYVVVIVYIPILLFNTHSSQNMIYVCSMLYIAVFAGMATGILLSVFCETLEMGSILCAGALFMTIFTSGTLWSLESINPYFRWVCELLPTTVVTVATRDMLYKELTFSHPQIYIAIIKLLVWTILSLLIGLKFYRFSK